MPRLSPLHAERDLQKYVMAFLGWFIVAVVLLGGAGIVAELRSLSGHGEGPGEWVVFRGAAGVVASVVSLRLPVLARRHAGEIARILGLKGQYLTAAVVTVVLPIPGSAVYWWAGLPATLAGLVALVLVARIEKVPTEEMTASIDHRNPAAWAGRSMLGERLVFLKAVVLGLLVSAAVVAVLLLVVR